MQVLVSSSARTCSFALDRVYGIMQIFGDEFRVGKAATAIPLLPPSYSLGGLQDELGALVVEKYPENSQFLVHDTVSYAAKGWRICGDEAVSFPRHIRQWDLGSTSGSAPGVMSARWS